MKIVYIAGPYRGETPWDVECNVRHAEELALRVAKAGAIPLCPHTMFRFFNKQCDDPFWLNGTLELLRRCDAIIMTDDWIQSEGAVGEYDEAKKLGMPTFIEIGDLKIWLHQCT